MTNAIAHREPELVAPAVTKDDLELIKRTIANGATDAELRLFLFDCKRRGVHPLDKLIHFTKRGGKYTPVTSIDFMRSQAAMTGEMAGSDDPDFAGYINDSDNSPPNRATVTVYRLTQGQRFGYTATARWVEYYPGDQTGHMWRKMPHTMLGKCAEALALRKAFPQQLAGLYAQEEMDQIERGPLVVSPPPAASVAPPPVTEPPQAAEPVPPAPSGYRKIDVLKEDNGWILIEFHDPERQKPAERYKTKLRHLVEKLRCAYRDGLSISVDVTPNKEIGEPGWINGVEVWPPIPGSSTPSGPA